LIKGQRGLTTSKLLGQSPNELGGKMKKREALEQWPAHQEHQKDGQQSRHREERKKRGGEQVNGREKEYLKFEAY